MAKKAKDEKPKLDGHYGFKLKQETKDDLFRIAGTAELMADLFRELAEAAVRYAKANDGQLPRDLEIRQREMHDRRLAEKITNETRQP